MEELFDIEKFNIISDAAKTSDEIKEIIKTRYKSEKSIDTTKSGMKKGIIYKCPHARVSSYQSLNEEIDLTKQPMLDETRAILFNIRDYLCEPWQKEKIIKIQNEEKQKIN